MVIIFGGVTDDSYSSCRSLTAHGNSYAGGTAVLHEIIGDTDIVAPHGNSDDIQICGGCRVADVGVDFSVICRGEIRDTRAGLIHGGRRDAVVIEDVMINCEVIPESDIDQIVRIGSGSGNEIVMDVRPRGTYVTATQRNTEAAEVRDYIVSDLDLSTPGSRSEESELLGIIGVVANDRDMEGLEQSYIAAFDRRDTRCKGI